MIKSSVEFDFTDSQRELIEKPGSVLVEACPGAGKTQCIVQRFIERPGLDSRRGVALLSFTNAAITAAEARCVHQPAFLRPPNYLGTIDRFINRYIVGPTYAARYDRLPSFKDTWDAVPGSRFRVRGINDVEFHLAWFSFDANGSARLSAHKIPFDLRARAIQYEVQRPDEIHAEAEELRGRFVRRGLVDCEYSRILMCEYFDDPVIARKLRFLLDARFSEIIIDEVQDSNQDDVRLIDFLLSASIRVVMVGDGDQAIYNFRDAGGTPVNAMQVLRGKVPSGTRLDGNFRSSPAICNLVDSLRFGASTDRACGKWSESGVPVQVVKLSRLQEAPEKIAKIAIGAGFDIADVVVLAHGESHARSCAGASPQQAMSSSRIIRLAQAAALVQHPSSTAHVRSREMRRFEAVIRELTPDDINSLSDADFFAQVGLSERGFREGCLRLLWRVEPFAAQPSLFRGELKKGLDGLGWSDWVDLVRLRSPKGDEWPSIPKEDTNALRWSTVHGFKGLQAPAVAVVIPAPGRNIPPNQTSASFWRSDQADEARRVLYVAASRAEQLAMLMVERSQYAMVLETLSRDAVPYVEV